MLLCCVYCVPQLRALNSVAEAASRVRTILTPAPPGFPPGPPGDVSLQLLADPLRFLLETRSNHGPCVGMVLGGQRVVLVAEADAARDVLIERANTVFVKEGTAFFPGSSLAGNGRCLHGHK